MQQKSNNKVLWIAVILILLSVILQSLAMKSIINAQTYSEEYVYGNFIDKDLLKYKRIPIPKEVLDAKFSEYKHESEDGKNLVIFTNEQYDELSQMRSDKTRDALNVDEVLYIIEDSIDIYFSYDQITLTGNKIFTGYLPPVFDSSSSLIPIFPNLTVSRPIDIENFRPFDSFYERVISDIYRIIYFRLSVHDSGLMDVYEMKKNKESVLVLRSDDLSDLYMDGWRLEMVKYVMLVNESRNIGEDYQNDLIMHFHTYLQNHKNTQHKEALDFDSISMQDPAMSITDGGKEIVMWDIKTLGTLKIFPTLSLETRAKEIYNKWLSENSAAT